MRSDHVTARLFISLLVGICLGSRICILLPPQWNIVGFGLSVVISVTLLAWKEILFALPIAYRDLIQRIRSIRAYYDIEDPAKRWSRMLGTTLVGEVLLLCLYLIGVSIYLEHQGSPAHENNPLIIVGLIGLIIYPGLSALYTGFSVTAIYEVDFQETRTMRHIQALKQGLLIASPIGPIILLFIGAKLLGIFAWKVILVLRIVSWELIRGTGRLIKYIYTFVTALCAVYAFVGTVFTYGYLYLYLGMDMTTALCTGSLLGALFGVLNFEIVSKRLFHLVPIRPS